MVIVALWAAFAYLPQALGACPAYPHDARAYAQPSCGLMDGSQVTTFDEGLTYYRLPMPADAQGVRFFIDPGTFNGGDAFFLRFAASHEEASAFLAGLHAEKSDESAQALWTDDSQGQNVSAIPWRFDSTAYTAYRYTVHGDPNTGGGTVTVDWSSADPVVYVVAAGLE